MSGRTPGTLDEERAKMYAALTALVSVVTVFGVVTWLLVLGRLLRWAL